jgi:hypothetical protein
VSFKNNRRLALVLRFVIPAPADPHLFFSGHIGHSTVFPQRVRMSPGWGRPPETEGKQGKPDKKSP